MQQEVMRKRSQWRAREGVALLPLLPAPALVLREIFIWVQSERELKQSQVLLLPVSSWSQTSFSLPLAYPDLG